MSSGLFTGLAVDSSNNIYLAGGNSVLHPVSEWYRDWKAYNDRASFIVSLLCCSRFIWKHFRH